MIDEATRTPRAGRREWLGLGGIALACVLYVMDLTVLHLAVLAAFSTTPEMLIATRALLGVSGATLAPSTLSLIRSMFHDPRQRTTAIAIWITSFSAGAAIGPVLGGVVLEFF